MTLRQKIEQEIRQRGPIPFSRYMELCLYEPQLGYYQRQAQHFGKKGDFYTASDVHAVFGRLLARQFDEMWRAMGAPPSLDIFELGPGRGLLAQDVLDWSEKKFPQFFRTVNYRLLEGSSELRRRLEQTLRSHFQRGKASLVDATQSADPVTLAGGGPTIVLANEFFDALPVEVLAGEGELRIDVRNGQFVETWVQASRRELEYLDHYSIHPEAGERVETPLVAQDYMKKVAASLKHGFVVAIDYGYTRQELLAGRHRGTVMAYRQHSASSNPYQAPGEQDITAHVNFIALAAAAKQNGMNVERLLTQSQFLLGIGELNRFADAFEDCQLPQERAKVVLQLRHLVTPAGMGETFQVFLASKAVPPEQVKKLSGISFAGDRQL